MLPTQHIGEFVTSVAFTFEVGAHYSTPEVPEIYGYTAGTPSEGAAEVAIYHETPTAITQVQQGSANLTGSTWWSCKADTSFTTSIAGEYIGIFDWVLNSKHAYGVSRARVFDPNAADPADGSGRIVALHVFDRPEMQHVIHETIDGHLVTKQDPR